MTDTVVTREQLYKKAAEAAFLLDYWDVLEPFKHLDVVTSIRTARHLLGYDCYDRIMKRWRVFDGQEYDNAAGSQAHS